LVYVKGKKEETTTGTRKAYTLSLRRTAGVTKRMRITHSPSLSRLFRTLISVSLIGRNASGGKTIKKQDKAKNIIVHKEAKAMKEREPKKNDS
jgi:hypothetical protein